MRPVVATFAVVVALVGEVAADEAKDRFRAGERAFTDGDLARAVDELRAATAIAPTPKGLILLGNACMRLGRLDEAREALERALAIDPTSRRRATVERMIRDLQRLDHTRLLISSKPSGATIYIDLKAEGSRGKTPLLLPVPPGRHRVILELAGHETAAVDAVAVEGSEVPVAAELRKPGCDVMVAARPAGVTVRLDDAPAVATPARLRITPGEHKLAFAGKGLIAKSRAVRCEGTRALEPIDEALEAVPTGVLSVRAPTGAALLIDGAPPAGDPTRLVVAPGEHRVEVSKDGVTWRATANVHAGEEVVLAPELVAPPAPPPRQPEVPVWKRGVFWGALAGAIVVGGGVAAIIAVSAQPRDATPPASTAGTAVLSFR